MPSRLPTPGGDQGNWGDILNDFLNQSHTSTGTLKDNVVGDSQLQDGAVTRAKTSSAVQASLDAADNAIPASQKGASGGVASLTGTTLTPAQIPTTVVTKSTDSNDTGKAIDAHTGAPLVVVTSSDLDNALLGGLVSSHAAIGADQSISGVYYNNGSPTGSNAASISGLELPIVLGADPIVLEARVLVLSGAAQDITVGIWDRDAVTEYARAFQTATAGGQWHRVICETPALFGDGETERVFIVRIAPYASGTTMTVKGVTPFTSTFRALGV